MESLAKVDNKVQRMTPWKYLGLEITTRIIIPQKLEINCNPEILADLHSLCGSLNWVKPWLGLTDVDLEPLFNLLKGERELVSPRELTPEAKAAIKKVQKALAECQAHRYKPELPFKFIVLGKLPHLHGLIFQWIEGQKDSLLIIEWVFLSHQRSKTITKTQELIAQLIRKARIRLHELAGCDFTCIHLPVKLSEEGRNSPERLTKEFFDHCSRAMQASNWLWTATVDKYQSIPRRTSCSMRNSTPFPVRSWRPLKALTLFMDESGASHKSVMTWRNPKTQHWEADVEFVEGSPQVAELAAVVRAFEKFSEPINLVTDSAYVAGVVPRAEQAVLKLTMSSFSGEIAEGNCQADSLATPAEQACLPDIFQRAKLSYQQYHQNVPGQIRQFQITRSQARAVVATCPSCQLHAMPSLENTFLPPNPVMNPIQVEILLTMNSLAAAWIVPQPRQNVLVTLA
ncbi:endogenous retrovirus group K member 11 Pol protein-like protein [Turdus rufiventris]|nr:endogenous retrovirus group K member 11 Pol protein-like protein [Turdus rufiventris]